MSILNIQTSQMQRRCKQPTGTHIHRIYTLECDVPMFYAPLLNLLHLFLGGGSRW